MNNKHRRKGKIEYEMEESDVINNEVVWIPPSETEMKVIQAKRERSDKIAKIIAQYLLKGYKMIGPSCETCETVLLQDRQGKEYCVACFEVDNEHTKDNPVLNGIAAKRKLEESDHRCPNDSTTVTDTTALLLTQSTTTSASNSSVPNCNDSNSWITLAENILKDTLISAADHIKSSKCVDSCTKYCTLVKACADALSSLKALKDNNLTNR